MNQLIRRLSFLEFMPIPCNTMIHFTPIYSTLPNEIVENMKAASLHELKKELDELEVGQLKSLCLRLSKFKKDNKELLTYLLFEAQDESGYVESIKREVTEQFGEISNLNTYYLKKSLRRILKLVNKQIRYSGLPETELELRIHFCQEIKNADLLLTKSIVLINLYEQQLKKIHQALAKLDEDLQFDYQSQIGKLSINRVR